MPMTLSFPGVYIEEIPSGVRTITGVPTSITAFVGRAARGPVNNPVPIFSFGDYERTFGGLWAESSMSYAVRDFFLNGGSQAVIVRLFKPDPADKNVSAANPNGAATLPVGGLTLIAASPGGWGQNLRASISVPPADARSVETRAILGIGAGDALFTLTVTDTSPGGSRETFTNLTLVDSPHRIDRVLKSDSTLVNFAGPTDTKTGLPDLATSVSAADDPATKAASDAKQALGAAKQQVAALSAPPPTTTATDDKTAAANVAAAVTAQTAAQTALTTAKAAKPPDAAAIADAQTKSDAADLAVADAQLIEANTQLATAQAVKPPVAADVAKAQAAIAAATTVFQTAADAASASARGAVTRASAAALANPASPVSDGLPLDDPTYRGSRAAKSGFYALENTDIFNLLCIPPPSVDSDTPITVYQEALPYCVERRAMLLLDPPGDWMSAADITASNEQKLTDLNLTGPDTRNAAIYFPRVLEADPLRGGQIASFVPCGIVAGVMSQTDAQRGVWKAPAGLDASLNGTMGLAVPMTNGENGLLNPLGINCLRTFPIFGSVVWGARTLRGADEVADDYKYIPVRRLALFIEESLRRDTKWIVFEPNDEPLWAQIRLNVGAFMHDLFRQGAFEGDTPSKAYFVKCDGESTTQNDIDHGIVNIIVGFAPLKPAEFVVIQLQQIAGAIQA